jgi:SulP family sulfate permease
MLRQIWSATSAYFLRPVSLIRSYPRENFKADLIAGLTVGIVAFPQTIAFAMIAELPPQYGLYAAITTGIIGALWGSSQHLNTGPTNTVSLLVLVTLLPIAEAGTEKYLLAAGLMAVMVGVFKITLGVVRLGVLVNFVSDSVIIGFSTGAGVLIIANQLRHLLRLDFPSEASLITTLRNLAANISDVHWMSLILGSGVCFLIFTMKRYAPKWPGALIGMILATGLVAGLNLDQAGLRVVGKLPRSLPPLVNIPLFDLNLIGQLSTGALAVGAISLVESTAISRAIASQSDQQLDNNQEFIGQGLANLVAGFFSGYVVSGSFTRSAINYEAGAKTSLSSVISSVFILVVMLLIAPLAALLPRTALAGVLLFTALGMIDRAEIVRIWRGARGDAAIMIITFVSTLLFPLHFAVLTGILISFAVYITQTSVPRVVPVLPSDDFSHFTPEQKTLPCTQLAILDILGDLYFGASSHVEEVIRNHLEAHPTQRFLLLRMFSVDHIDISGVHALESVVRGLRQRGGDVFMMRTQDPVLDLFKSTGFYDYLGEDHFLAYGDAISYLFYRILDPTICIYECDTRAFRECINLPRPEVLPSERILPLEMPLEDIKTISPQVLWGKLHERNPPVVIDVREPREYKMGHIPQAKSNPIFKLIADTSGIPKIRQVVLVCRTGRRSRRVIHLLHEKGFTNILMVEGGMVAWENAGLLEAIEK